MPGYTSETNHVASHQSASATPHLPLSLLISRLLTFSLVISAALTSFYPLLGKAPWMVYQEDDFFYYLKIADNLAHGRGSTWSGLVPTNGYHPLWLALLAAQSRIFGSIFALQIFLSLAIFLAAIATYLLSRRLLQRHCDNPPLTSALAVYIALYSLHLFNGGMEIILTIPLVLAIALAFQSERLWQHTSPWPPFGFGLLVSALCLSRLDTSLFVALLFLLTLLHPALRARLTLRQTLLISLGLTPVVLYLLSNHIFFHSWLPVSGMAKQLRATHLPAWPVWRSLFSKSPLRLLNFLAILFAIALLSAIYRRFTAAQQVIYPLLLLFPFFYLFVLSCLSDWQLWDWYFYCLRTALCAAFALFLLWRPTARCLNHIAITSILILIVLGQLLFNRRNHAGAGGLDIYAVATQVRDFSATHPGVYAMGDRSGMVGYLLPYPLVQTEGLVMDRHFIDVIKQHTPLLQALAPFHVRYYIATSTSPYIGCFHAIEPSQAGPDSAHMIGDLCAPPIVTWTNHSGQTLIFDLDAAPPKP
jgi:hypothetical protein